MKNIFETVNYQYPKPINYKENDGSFDHFKNYPDQSCQEPKISWLKNVRIATNSVVFKYFKIFPESCIGKDAYDKYQKGFGFFLKFIFPKFNFRKKRFIVITDEWTSNYYHWHAFALKKLLILREENLIKDSLLFLPKKYQKYSFTMPSIKSFGIKEDQIVFVPKKSNIKVSEAVLILPPRQHPELYKEIRRTLLSNIAKKQFGFGDKIYISRQGQKFRFVENEVETTALLEKHGFKKIIAEQFSYEDQIAICSEAKYLVSPHGAGLTNLMFLKDGGSVLEIATPRETFNQDFYALASMLNLKYFYQEDKVGPNSNFKQDFHHGSLVIDLEKLEENIKLMLQ